MKRARVSPRIWILLAVGSMLVSARFRCQGARTLTKEVRMPQAGHKETVTMMSAFRDVRFHKTRTHMVMMVNGATLISLGRQDRD